VFLQDEVRLPLGLATAQARLASLAASGLLLNAAQAAAGDGNSVLARVGPLGPVPGLSRVVEVQFQDLIVRGESAQLALRWQAAGGGGGLFPALDADITLTAVDDEATTMTLAGVYRPPLGNLGAGLDQAVLHRVARATIRHFLSRLASAIAQPHPAAEPQRAIRPGLLTELGPAPESGTA